ncbi:unnamed protein product [Cuscuta campestris]|uniref:Uncharacterized protein n=1 Tax=Cuscuta campestris TaxID=132261 RepID=A0A484MVY0_9ASTE|nr:unnamed protein product [Cuscuta campestris]
MTLPSKAASDFKFNSGAKSEEDEDVTIFFRLHRQIFDYTKDVATLEDKWFSISTRHASPHKDGDKFLPPITREPDQQYYDFCPTPPFAVGPYLFTIRVVDDETDEDAISRRVFYLDTRNIKDGWKEAPRPQGIETCNYCFFQANDNIYALGVFEEFLFDLKCLDCHELSKGWQSLSSISDELSDSPLGFCLYAFKLEYATTAEPATSKICHATRAVIFLLGRRISYDFESNSFDVSESHIGHKFYCRGVGVGDLIYFLRDNQPNKRAILMAYNDRLHKWYPTPVLGLDNSNHALPVGYKLYRRFIVEYPPAKLLVIREGRLCILWADIRSDVTQIHCTKFNVHVKDEQPHAVNVSTQVYRVKGFHTENLEAVFSSSETIRQFLERESSQAGRPSESQPGKAHKGKGVRRQCNGSS